MMTNDGLGDIGYPDLLREYLWRPGVHRAPVGYQHPWLLVTFDGTRGHWTREEARVAWREIREGNKR